MSELSEILYNRTVYLCSITNTKQNDLANAINISQNSITNWKKSMPSLDKIICLANQFDVSFDYLLGRTDNPKSHKNPNHFKDHTKRLIIASEQLDCFDDVKEALRKLLLILNALNIKVSENGENMKNND